MAIPTTKQLENPSKKQRPPESNPSRSKKRRTSSHAPSMDSLALDDATWKSLFNFTMRQHLAFAVPGLFFSILSGLSVPVNSFILGRVFGVYSEFGNGVIDGEELMREINVWGLRIFILGVGSWFANGMAFIMWYSFGDLQARNARERLFNGLL